ncbi:MAG: hypothetical protein INR73_01865 [Williamsia sp.]|nr:hypothetical protein [Williamsia sp.]
MSFDLKKLYELLPALYRIRDTRLGTSLLTGEQKAQLENFSADPDALVYGPLKSLLSVIAEQIAVLDENLEQLYDDQFIETCAEWAVSYIGELVGTRGLIPLKTGTFSQRSEVANTIAYRRRKGTASVIEQLARDVTGWNANVVEYFQLLATTQYLNHLRPQNLSASPVRDWELLEYANTPFDKMAHTADVRRIEKKRGKYNIKNIGIYLWRLNSYSLTKVPAYKVDERRYLFDPLGKNKPLYNLPETEDKITHLATPLNVPMPISRRVLAGYLEVYYGQDTTGLPVTEADDQAADKSILLYKDGDPVLPQPAALPPKKLEDLITVCNLRDVYDSSQVLTGWAHQPQNKIAIDPVLGRIAFPASQPPPGTVHTTFYYGFSTEMGGGEYSRATTFTQGIGEIIKVSAGNGTIQAALDQLASTGGVVEIEDGEYYFETPLIRVKKGLTIELRAADECRPVLVLDGEILVEAEENATVILNGLLLSGGRTRLPLITGTGQQNGLQRLRLVHCTLLPGPSPRIGPVAAQPVQPRLVVESPDTSIEIEKTITGAMRVFDGAKVIVGNSIIDAGEETAIAYAGLSVEEPGGTLHITNSTTIGKVYTMLMELASNSVFMAGDAHIVSWPAPVLALRLQQGCVRFSYFPPGSRLPRPYHCQPVSLTIADRVRPLFTSLTYGDPGYCQLHRNCAAEISQGADDEAEMGVFHDLFQPQREANLRTRLDEYLRFGLEAGIFYAS